jgi:hypothetical protein
MNVVPFKPPETFERFGIDWTRDATNDRERSLREAYLTYESSCGPNGLVSLVLLAVVCGRQGAVAGDLQAAADLAETMLSMKLRKHRDDTLEAVHEYLSDGGAVWPGVTSRPFTNLMVRWKVRLRRTDLHGGIFGHVSLVPAWQ